MSLPRIAIATGDPAGIGPEIALKAALAPQVRKICRPLLVGDRSALEAHADACGLKPDLRCLTRAADAAWNDGALTLVERRQFKPGELHIGAIAAPHGEAALDSAKTAIDAALAGEVDAVVAAPHTESSIKLAGIDFDGYPPFVADTMFLKKGYDAFVVMIHDQGHILAKTQAFSDTAALTIGTPVLFSSVAHGSALDIAGKNRADPGAIISAIRRVAGASPAS